MGTGAARRASEEAPGQTPDCSTSQERKHRKLLPSHCPLRPTTMSNQWSKAGAGTQGCTGSPWPS
eukprot:2748858-Lingulodinium_polyedra.AAC.1